MLRGGIGKYFGEVTDQSAHGTVSWRNIVGVEILNDGRPDFASNPFNGPQPTYDQLVLRTCWDQKVNQGGARPGCIRRTVGNNLSSPNSQYPHSWQGSIGFQRQLSNSMAVEADYVYWASAHNVIGNVNINQSFNAATGLPNATTNVALLPFPEWGNVAMRNHTLGYDSKNHSVQVGLTKRLSNRWQASASYLWVRDFARDTPPLLPDLPGIPEARDCTYPVTWTADRSRWVCDVPVNFRAFGVPIYDEEWYVTGHQVHRAAFNAIYELPYGMQVSGLYFYGDNGKETTTSGVDVLAVGGVVANRTRADRFGHSALQLRPEGPAPRGRAVLTALLPQRPILVRTARRGVQPLQPGQLQHVEPEREQQQLRTAAAGRWRQQRRRWNRVPAARRPARLQGHVLNNAQPPIPNSQ